MTYPKRTTYRRALLTCVTTIGSCVLLPPVTAQAATSHHKSRHAKAAPVTATPAPAATAQTSTTLPPATTEHNAAAQASIDNSSPESIQVRAMRRLIREKDSPSAVTELGARQISANGSMGSIVTLLRQAPSVYVYQQGPGNNEPVFTIRGTRGMEVAQTLDGIPMQDLLNGGSGSYLQGIAGFYFNTDQISGVSLYPGVAYPDQSTFGTIGGTVAYKSMRPSTKRGLDVFGGVGSFGTWKEGFKVDSGSLDGALGRGVDAPRLMLQYSNMQTKGYIENTPARFNSMEAAFDKPYDSGQSMFQATVLYNTGSSNYIPEPIPSIYQQKYGNYFNYPKSEQYAYTRNDYFTLMLKNDTYINDYISVGLSGFYRYNNSYSDYYSNINTFAPAGAQPAYSMNGVTLFNQTLANFAYQSVYGYGNPYYQPGVVTYDGNALYNNTSSCPSSYVAQYAGSPTPCGYNSYEQYIHTNTYGIQPRISIRPPDIFGIRNTIHIGALIARETQNNLASYAGVTPNIPHDEQNRIPGYGSTFRNIYSGYAQDRIDLLHNSLHITGGFTIQGTKSGYTTPWVYDGGSPPASYLAANSAYCNQYSCSYGPYKSRKWDRNWLPFANVTFDFDKISPVLRGLSAYGSMGTSALYAPVSDFGPTFASAPPSASIVHMYEGGIKYNTGKLAVSADYYYQKVDRDFGYFSDQTPNTALYGKSLYTNDGERLMRGVEMNVIYQINKNWQLFGNWSYNSARYLKTYFAFVTVQEDQFGIASRGSHVTGIPSWLSTFGVDYHKTDLLLHDDDLNVRFTGQYTGHQYTTYDLGGFENVGPLPGVTSGTSNGYGSYNYYNAVAGSTTMDPKGGIAPYMIFSINIDYHMPVHNLGPLKSIDFNMNVYNLFNTFYWQYKYKQISPNGSGCGNFASNPPGFNGFAGQPVNIYNCSTQFSDGIPGVPAQAMFTVRAHF
ncbi:TonB-dependent receptor [Acidomonas methanolica]|uniref:TonB-dependent receptor n=1 Tax=Acidomonas methanolica TaxID=437 RepID=UPI00211A0B9B|nr:TonB-dependent receptor plug domain-containing protein [Acidomonas methanolica]